MTRFRTTVAALIALSCTMIAKGQSTQPTPFSIEQLFRLRAGNHLVSLMQNRTELNLTPEKSNELDVMHRELTSKIDSAAMELRSASAPPEQWLARADEIRRAFFELKLMPWQTANADTFNRAQRIQRLNEKVYGILSGETRGDLLKTATKVGLEPSKTDQALKVIESHRQAIQSRGEVNARRDEEMRRLMPAGQMNLDQYKRETELMQAETFVQMQRIGSAVRRELRELLPEAKRADLDIQLSM